MLWVPKAEGSSEPVVYAIELVDVIRPTPVMAAPGTARATAITGAAGVGPGVALVSTRANAVVAPGGTAKGPVTEPTAAQTK